MDNDEVKKVGLILSGGGAKGAYEIGVIKALEDLGLADTVTGVAGTSVGALNSILFVNRDINKAFQIWDEVEQKDFTHADIPKMMGKVVTTHMLHILWGIINKNPTQIPLLIGQSVKAYKYIYSIFIFLSGGIFSQKKLEELIDKFNLIQKENYSKYDVFATVYNANKGKVEYHSCQDKEPDKVKEIILASANLPIVYPAKRMVLDKKKSTYYDGGIGDNTPIKPLYDKGYRDFFVVYLINQGKLEKVIDRKNKEFPGAKIYNIYPDDDFKSGIFATLTINKENTRKLMHRGYKDTMKFLKNKIVSND